MGEAYLKMETRKIFPTKTGTSDKFLTRVDTEKVAWLVALVESKIRVKFMNIRWTTRRQRNADVK